MEVLAFFLLVVALVVLAIAGLLVFGVAGRLRRAKLDPERDRLAEPDAEDESRRGRPEHVRAEPNQRSRFLTHR